MDVLIVGGTGFVGSYIFEQLKAEHNVHLTSHSTPSSDIKYKAETDNLEDLVNEDYDLVINNINPQNLSYVGTAKNAESVVELCKKTDAWLIQISSFFASKENRKLNSYTQKKAIAEDIIQTEMPVDSYTILRFPQFYDYNNLSRATQGGLFYLAETIGKNQAITKFINHTDCVRNYMPIELGQRIIQTVIDNRIKGCHNAYFDEFTLSFNSLIKIFEGMRANPIELNHTFGDRTGMTYSIEAESKTISEKVQHLGPEQYFQKLFNSINLS